MSIHGRSEELSLMNCLQDRRESADVSLPKLTPLGPLEGHKNRSGHWLGN